MHPIDTRLVGKPSTNAGERGLVDPRILVMEDWHNLVKVFFEPH